MSRNYVDPGYTIHHQNLLFNLFALIESLYIGIVIVDSLAEIAAHFIEFHNAYCCAVIQC